MSNSELIRQISRLLGINTIPDDQLAKFLSQLTEEIKRQRLYSLSGMPQEISAKIVEYLDLDSLIKIADNIIDVKLYQEALRALRNRKSGLAGLSIYDMRNYKPKSAGLKRLFATELHSRLRSNSAVDFINFKPDVILGAANYSIPLSYQLLHRNSYGMSDEIFSHAIIKPEDLMNESLVWKDGVSFRSTIKWDVLISNPNLSIEFIVNTVDQFPWNLKLIQNNPNLSADNVHLVANHIKNWFKFVRETATIELIQQHPELMKNNRYLIYRDNNQPMLDIQSVEWSLIENLENPEYLAARGLIRQGNNFIVNLGTDPKFIELLSDPNGTAIFITEFIQNPNVTDEFIQSIPGWQQVERFINQINVLIYKLLRLFHSIILYSPGLSFKFITDHPRITWGLYSISMNASAKELLINTNINNSFIDRSRLSHNHNLTLDIVNKYSIKPINSSNPIINLRNLLDQLENSNLPIDDKKQALNVYIQDNPNLTIDEMKLFKWNTQNNTLIFTPKGWKIGAITNYNSLTWNPTYIKVVEDEIKRLLV